MQIFYQISKSYKYVKKHSLASKIQQKSGSGVHMADRRLRQEDFAKFQGLP